MSNAPKDPPTKENQSEQFNITPDVKKLLLDRYAPHIYKIESKDTGKEYCISLVKNHFTCSCPSWTFRARNPDGSMKQPPYYCKHQLKLAVELMEGAK